MQRCQAMAASPASATWQVSDVVGLVQQVPSENIGAAFGDAFLVGGGRFGCSRRGLESDCRDRFGPIPSAPFATTDSIEGIEIFIHPQ